MPDGPNTGIVHVDTRADHRPRGAGAAVWDGIADPGRPGGKGLRMTTASPSSGPPRRLVGSYERYADAQRAVDTLSDRRFPVERVTIVGSDLRLVEQVTGRLTVLRAALAGAATGAWIGLLIGLVVSIVSPWDLSPILTGILFGLAFGAFWGAVAHAVTGGRRDFASVRTMEAARYEVLAEEPYADQALRILGDRQATFGEGAAAAIPTRHRDDGL